MYQVISFLNKLENSDKKFKRINDEKFKLFKGSYGDLMYELNDILRPLPIFLYMHDEWELIEEE
jgi:hypothetical protein